MKKEDLRGSAPRGSEYPAWQQHGQLRSPGERETLSEFLSLLSAGANGLSFFGADPAVKGHGDIRLSAKEFAGFVDKVLVSSGSSQVDIVGHSQGGIVPRQYMKFEGGADLKNPARNKVRNLVTLGATHHGTTLSGLATLAGDLRLVGFSPILLGEAGKQQVRGSEFLNTLNAGGDAVPGVNYQVIATDTTR